MTLARQVTPSLNIRMKNVSLADKATLSKGLGNPPPQTGHVTSHVNYSRWNTDYSAKALD